MCLLSGMGGVGGGAIFVLGCAAVGRAEEMKPGRDACRPSDSAFFFTGKYNMGVKFCVLLPVKIF